MVAKLHSSPQVVKVTSARPDSTSDVNTDVTQILEPKHDEIEEENDYENHDYVLDSLEEALEIQKERRGTDHEDVVRTLHSLSLEYKIRKRWDDAIRCLNEAIDLIGDRLEEKTKLLTCMGNIYKSRRMYAKSMDCYLNAVGCLTEMGATGENPQLSMLVRMVKRLEKQIRTPVKSTS